MPDAATLEAPAEPAADTGEYAPDGAATAALYEGMFVFESGDYATEGEEYVARVIELIERSGGVVDAHRMWVDGRLAYPIRNKRKGVHYIVLFQMEPAKVKELDRGCRLEDRILRHMVIRPPEEIYHATVDVVNPQETEGEEDGEVEIPA